MHIHNNKNESKVKRIKHLMKTMFIPVFKLRVRLVVVGARVRVTKMNVCQGKALSTGVRGGVGVGEGEVCRVSPQLRQGGGGREIHKEALQMHQ